MNLFSNESFLLRNLIKQVGYETCETTNDSILKEEMPSALKQVKKACQSLEESVCMLKDNPRSSIGKRNLIDGERGITNMFIQMTCTSTNRIFLVFEESCKAYQAFS